LPPSFGSPVSFSNAKGAGAARVVKNLFVVVQNRKAEACSLAGYQKLWRGAKSSKAQEAATATIYCSDRLVQSKCQQFHPPINANICVYLYSTINRLSNKSC